MHGVLLPAQRAMLHIAPLKLTRTPIVLEESYADTSVVRPGKDRPAATLISLEGSFSSELPGREVVPSPPSDGSFRPAALLG